MLLTYKLLITAFTYTLTTQNPTIRIGLFSYNNDDDKSNNNSNNNNIWRSFFLHSSLSIFLSVFLFSSSSQTARLLSKLIWRQGIDKLPQIIERSSTAFHITENSRQENVHLRIVELRMRGPFYPAALNGYARTRISSFVEKMKEKEESKRRKETYTHEEMEKKKHQADEHVVYSFF